MKSIEELLELAIDAALEAGKKILEVYETDDFSVDMKSDNSPLTKADKVSHQIICQYLSSSHLPLLSEEGTNIPFEERKRWEYYWLVDPLDGTKEFIKRNGEFTVNIALMKASAPITGVIYAPYLNTLYYGAKETGAYKNANGNKNSLPIVERSELQDLLQKDSVTIVASRSHSNPETEQFISRFKNYELQSMGSSLKFMLLADRAADIYPRLAPTMEWDTAAAHAILNAVNRQVYQTDLNSELVYNKANLLNPPFIAF
ncbi:MAG: 3'(2'),5'-bisphosphate nucleotidase CysQ [Bacteroidota bacterium]|nr:3'(2'),5'-bisphosphate nucleotidase CysQ [Bacteroidota bacterium]